MEGLVRVGEVLGQTVRAAIIAGAPRSSREVLDAAAAMACAVGVERTGETP